MSKKKPQILWANGVNLRGLWSDKPVKMYYAKSYYDDEDVWYDCIGNLSVEKIGLDKCAHHITFASEDKSEVATWTQGALALCEIMAQTLARYRLPGRARRARKKQAKKKRKSGRAD